MKKNWVDQIQEFDIFGIPVYLTHESKQLYKTNCGAFTSLLFFIGMLSYGLVLVSQVSTGQIQSLSTQITFNDPESPTSSIDFTQANLRFAFGFKETLDPRIGTLSIQYIVQNKTKTTSTSISIQPCETSLGFPKSFNYLLCPNQADPILKQIQI